MIESCSSDSFVIATDTGVRKENVTEGTENKANCCSADRSTFGKRKSIN